MQKRTSWDQKNKHIHKSRKKIIDTVFGREDNTQRVFGYAKELEQKHKVGEKWIDSNGKEWEQKEGYKVSVNKLDDVREYLKKITTCKNQNCKTEKYSQADKKLIVRVGYCVDCNHKYEQTLKNDGTYPFYEDYKITCNKLAYLRDYKQELEDNLKYINKNYQMIYETGNVENWTWDIDIEEVKKDLKKDIDSSYEALELLLNRKLLLEDKLRELNHSEIIKN
jgi:hypothetical protein